MTEETNIHELIKQLAKLGVGEIGKGPKHPQSPNHDLAEVVNKFLQDYSFLRQDAGYVEFLENYAGAGIQHPNEEFVVDLFGFTDVSTNFLDQDEYSIVDEDGFLTFCGGYMSTNENDVMNSMIPQGFLFDATGKRQWGIYRGAEKGPHYRYCKTFEEWLKLLVESKGKMPLHT